MSPKLPSDRDLFDKLVLVVIFFVMLGLVASFTFRMVDEKDSSWARETAAGIVGALLMKINSDRKPTIPEGASGTVNTIANVPAPPAVVPPVVQPGA